MSELLWGALSTSDKENAELRTQLEQAQAENEQLERQHDYFMEILGKENEQLKADKQKYEKELEWYADKENHIVSIARFPDKSAKLIYNDAGERARQVLSEVKGNV